MPAEAVQTQEHLDTMVTKVVDAKDELDNGRTEENKGDCRITLEEVETTRLLIVRVKRDGPFLRISMRDVTEVTEIEIEV